MKADYEEEMYALEHEEGGIYIPTDGSVLAEDYFWRRNSEIYSVLRLTFTYIRDVREQVSSRIPSQIQHLVANYQLDVVRHLLPFIGRGAIANCVVESVDAIFTKREAEAEALDIALSADLPIAAESSLKRRRGQRGGKRNLAKKPGFCYLKAVPKIMRKAMAEELGSKPFIEDVSLAYAMNDIVPRNLKVEFVREGAHMRFARGWPAALQWSIITSCDSKRRIGAEDWSDMDYPNAPGWSAFQESVFEEMFVKRDIMALYHALEAKEEEPQEMVEVPVRVRGRGDCWKRVFGSYFHIDSNRTDVTAQELLEALLVWRKRCVTLMKDERYRVWERAKLNSIWLVLEQPDGDLHMEDVYFDTEKTVPEMLAENPGYITGLDFAKLLNGKKTKLVGAPTRSTINANIANFRSPEVSGALEKLLQPLVRDSIDSVIKLCPYKIPKKNQHLMEQLAIPWLEDYGEDHPHPIHAAIRRWVYLVELPKYIKSDCTFLGMKESHFNMVSRAVESLHGVGTYRLKLINPIVDLRDVGRYAGTNSVPEPVWDIPKIDTPMLYCDESGHYLSPYWMVLVKYRNPNLRCIGMSNIFPLLSLEFPISPEPEYVEWRVEKRKGKDPVLIYIPEEDSGGKYEQPYDPTMTLLRQVRDTKGDVVWNGGVVAKKGNLRLQMFYPYHIATPEFLVETEFAMMPLPRVFRNQPDVMPVKVDSFIKMFEYAKTLVSDKPENQWAKLRMFLSDPKVYCPHSTKELLVKVVMECATQATVCDLASKCYNSLAEEVHYKTIGHIHRLFQKLTSVRYMKRNRKILDHFDPVQIFPTIKVVVKPSDDGSVYGTSWEIDEDSHLSFWLKFKNWLCVMGRKAKLLEPEMLCTLGEDGSVIFPFVHNTTYYRKLYGKDVIKEVQAKDFRVTFEGDEPVKCGIVKVKALGRYAKKLPPVPEEESTVVSDFDSNIDFALRSITQSASSSSTDLTDTSTDSTGSLEYVTDTSDTSDEESEVTAHSLGKGTRDVIRHCPACPSFMEYVGRGGSWRLPDYRAYCEARHNAAEADNPQLRRVLRGLADRTMMNKDTKLPGETETTWREVRENAAPPTRVVTAQLTQAQWAARQIRQEVVDGLLKQDYMRTSGDKYCKNTWEDRQANWLKLDKSRPAAVTHAHAATGETLWDLMYPLTVSKRFNRIPYRDVVEYPMVEYPRNDCLLTALAEGLGQTTEIVLFRMLRAFPRSEALAGDGLALKCIDPVALSFGVKVRTVDVKGNIVRDYGVTDARWGCELEVSNVHIKYIGGKKPLLIREPWVKPTDSGAPSMRKIMDQLNLWPPLKWVEWEPEFKRASDYVRALKAGTTGLLGNMMNEQKILTWEAMIDSQKLNGKKYFAMVAGDP